MMYAIYYKDPETGDRFGLASGQRSRDFFPLTIDPTLYAQADNARKVVRAWQREDKGSYGRKLTIYDTNLKLVKQVSSIDYKDIEIVAIGLAPDFSDTITGDKA